MGCNASPLVLAFPPCSSPRSPPKPLPGHTLLATRATLCRRWIGGICSDGTLATYIIRVQYVYIEAEKERKRERERERERERGDRRGRHRDRKGRQRQKDRAGRDKQGTDREGDKDRNSTGNATSLHSKKIS